MENSTNERIVELADRVAQGDQQALAELFAEFRPRLWRMLSFRLHPRLQGRIDPDDVLQDAWLRAVERMRRIFTDGAGSCYIWFRSIASQMLIDLHRRHLGAERRNAALEQPLHGGWSAESTSLSLAHQLVGRLTSPSDAAMREERSRQIDAALEDMNEIDREVLALRHFEELTNAEAAHVLNITEQGASARYVRALVRLKQIVAVIPGLADGLTS